MTDTELTRIARSELHRIRVKTPIAVKITELLPPGSDARITYPTNRKDAPEILLELHPCLKLDTPRYIRYVVQHEISHYRSAKRRFGYLPVYQIEESTKLPKRIKYEGS